MRNSTFVGIVRSSRVFCVLRRLPDSIPTDVRHVLSPDNQNSADSNHEIITKIETVASARGIVERRKTLERDFSFLRTQSNISISCFCCWSRSIRRIPGPSLDDSRHGRAARKSAQRTKISPDAAPDINVGGTFCYSASLGYSGIRTRPEEP